MGWFNFTRDVDTTNILAGLKVDAEDISFTLEEVATATTLTVDHFLVIVNAQGNTKITLPAVNTTLPPSGNRNRIYTIKNIHGSGTVTIDANGSETIDGEQTLELKLQDSYVTIICDGTEWWIIGGMNVKLEELFETKLDAVVDELNKILIEAKQITLHQASMSGEDISSKDVSED